MRCILAKQDAVFLEKKRSRSATKIIFTNSFYFDTQTLVRDFTTTWYIPTFPTRKRARETKKPDNEKKENTELPLLGTDGLPH